MKEFSSGLLKKLEHRPPKVPTINARGLTKVG
jgi:hypothetical protein